MISIETMPFTNQANQDMHKSCLHKVYGSNCSNATQTYPIDLAKSEESQITLLENSLEFLRTQHHSMLKALHDEIEQLRKTNKALQFRLVMCCCASNNESGKNGQGKPACALSEDDRNKEMCELRNLLDEEKARSSILMQKLAKLESSHGEKAFSTGNHQYEASKERQENEQHQEKTKSGDRSHNVQENVIEEVKKISVDQTRQSTGKKQNGTAENYKTEKSTHSRQSRHASSNRIASPELNPDSSSSAIMLSPNTVIDTPDGFWVRPSVAVLNNVAAPRVSISPRESNTGRTSGYIMPVKLPVLRTSGSITQVTIKDTTKDIDTSQMLPPNDEIHDDSEEGTPSKKFSNQSNEARYGRSSKSVRNIIKMYEAARVSFSHVARSSSLQYAGSSSQHSHEPFLPAITKPDANNSSRVKKPKETPKKHTYRNSHHGYT